MIRQLAVASIVAGIVLMPATAAVASPVDVSNTFPSFTNPGDVNRGENAVVGDILNYEDVLTVDGVTVDARLTVLTVDGLIAVVDAKNDQTSSPWPQIFSKLQFQEDEIGSGKVRYLIEFTDHATGDPVVLTGLRVSVRDVDETQYIQATNVKSYSLSSSPATKLSVLTPSDDASVNAGEIRFASPSIGIAPTDEDYWVALSFNDVSAFTLELGQGDYTEFERAFYYLDFDTAAWTTPPTEIDAPSTETDTPSTETDTPSLTEVKELASTGMSGLSLSLIALGAIGLLTAGVTLRRRNS